MSLILSIEPKEAIHFLTNLQDGQEWQEFCRIIQENDIARLKKETDAELFGNLNKIDDDRLARIASLRYRVNALEEFIRMPQKIIDTLQLTTVGKTEAMVNEENKIY